MTIADLKSIVNNCETDPKLPVMVRVSLPDGGLANAKLKSFRTYADGLMLNVEI
jgi:hypothetical protein